MQSSTVTNRSNCRLCGHDKLSHFLRFDSIPFFDEIVTEDIRGSEFSYPMNLFFCHKCSSVQTLHDVNLHKYYKSYDYVASNSPFVQNYMRSLVQYCCQHFMLSSGDKVIEVGAADGYLLSLFNNRSLLTLGFEAAENLCAIARQKSVNVINALFTDETVSLIPESFQSSQLLIMLHTFDHLYDPSPFLNTVREVLDPKRGVFLIEVHDLYDIYLKHETALFGHEHATYLHYNTISRFLDLHGFRVVDFNFLPKEVCRGSSMIVAATLKDSDVNPSEKLSDFDTSHLDSFDVFLDFQKDVTNSFAKLVQYVQNGKRQGKKFAGYGGWGRGVTSLAIAGFTADDFAFVADSNSNLHGGYTPVSSIPIYGPECITRDAVDEVIVFNYAYMQEIKKSLSHFIAQGGIVHSVIDLLRIDS